MTRYEPFRKKKDFSLVILLVAIALFFSYSAYANLFGVRFLLTSAVYPFQYVAAGVWGWTTGVPANIIHLRNLSSDHAILKDKYNAALIKLAVKDELAAENKRLSEALGFKARSRYGSSMMAAKVIGRSGGSWLSLIEVNKGSLQGVRVDLPVVAVSGLVGRVVEVSSLSSKVQLIVDPLSAVAAASQRSRDQGVVSGYSFDRLAMNYVGTGAEISAGDLIVTSSTSGLFPPGIPIGTVTSSEKKESDLFYKITVRPAANLSRLEEVFILL
ncbi:MAG: rod shape-determining protein MreC [Candidatus Margulisbacteria bacterium]|nr:rod shape-determining protein MreC [Candidatus Margulisiibacteriota bacterium]